MPTLRSRPLWRRSGVSRALAGVPVVVVPVGWGNMVLMLLPAVLMLAVRVPAVLVLFLLSVLPLSVLFLPSPEDQGRAGCVVGESRVAVGGASAGGACGQGGGGGHRKAMTSPLTPPSLAVARPWMGAPLVPPPPRVKMTRVFGGVGGLGTAAVAARGGRGGGAFAVSPGGDAPGGRAPRVGVFPAGAPAHDGNASLHPGEGWTLVGRRRRHGARCGGGAVEAGSTTGAGVAPGAASASAAPTPPCFPRVADGFG